MLSGGSSSFWLGPHSSEVGRPPPPLYPLLLLPSQVYPTPLCLPSNHLPGVHAGSWCRDCKTQNSGLRSKEEKPRDPVNQRNRCNTQEGLLSVAQTGWLWSPGRQSTPNSKLGELYIDKKNHTISILHTGYKVIGYMFAKQSYWYKLRGLLFKLKAILLVQTVRAFVQT